MWGDQLWDPRTPHPLHRFDSFTSFATGYFHPSGASRTFTVAGASHLQPPFLKALTISLVWYRFHHNFQ